MRVPIATFAAIMAAMTAPALAREDCLPGLAKKAVACQPPGKAKSPAQQDARLGAPAPNSAVPIADYMMYGLPPAPRGQTYYVEGRQILRVDRRDRTVLEILSLAKLLGQ